jgi:hypothetical protein
VKRQAARKISIPWIILTEKVYGTSWADLKRRHLAQNNAVLDCTNTWDLITASGNGTTWHVVWFFFRNGGNLRPLHSKDAHSLLLHHSKRVNSCEYKTITGSWIG